MDLHLSKTILYAIVFSIALITITIITAVNFIKNFAEIRYQIFKKMISFNSYARRKYYRRCLSVDGQQQKYADKMLNYVSRNQNLLLFRNKTLSNYKDK
jgi:hypothetical protein